MQPLYGRADVLERMRRWMEQARGGSGRLLLFTGEPGIGKSRLAEQVAAEAAGRGARVAWGRSWEAGGAPAYWPWIQVFRELGLGVEAFAGTSAALDTGAAEARFAAFQRAVRALQAAAAEQPLALVLDDLHAADTPSLLLLLLLARELRHSAILVVGAYREAETRATPELAALLGKLARDAEVLPLRRLSPADVAAWARDAVGTPSAADAEELYRVTEGHPLFVVEVLQLGARAAASAAWPMGPGVLDERLGAISSEVRAILDVASVLGRDFSAGDLAATANAPPDRVVEALREARAASLVVDGDTFEGFRFSHVLLRDRLYRDLLPSTREALHFRAGVARLARGASAESVIHHLFEGQAAGEPLTVAEVGLCAAQAELSRLAFEEAVRIGRRALAVCVAHELPDRLRAALGIVVAEALIRLGQGAEGKALCVEASALAERAGADELGARAALVYATELASGTIDPQMVTLLRQALARLGPDPSTLRARVMARLSAALTPPADVAQRPEIVELMRGARVMARALGDPHALLYVLQLGATVALLVPEDERFSTMAESLELGRALGQPLVLLSTFPAYVTALLARGERARAEAELPAYDALLVDFPQALHRLRRLLVEGMLAALSGDFAAAERAGQESLALARQSSPGPGMLLWLTHRIALAQLRARPELVVAEVAPFLDEFEAMPSAVPHLPWLFVGMGRGEEAAVRLRRTRFAALEVPSENLIELMGAAEASVLLGDAALAERLYPLLLRASDRMLGNLAPGALLGPTGRVLGDLARLLGKPVEAVRHYDEAIAFAEKLRAPPIVELCRASRQAVLVALGEGTAAPAEARAASTPQRATPSPANLIHPLLRRDGELWVIALPEGSPVRLKHSKGLAYLQALLDKPGRQVHVLELAGIEHYTGDAGAVLDPRAKLEYKRRLDDLEEGLGEAESFGDLPRAQRLQAEIDALTEQLAQAVGLGGRDRRAASDVERTRVNVQRRLKDAIDRITRADPTLGRYLAATVETGTYCKYQPL